MGFDKFAKTRIDNCRFCIFKEYCDCGDIQICIKLKLEENDKDGNVCNKKEAK